MSTLSWAPISCVRKLCFSSIFYKRLAALNSFNILLLVTVECAIDSSVTVSINGNLYRKYNESFFKFPFNSNTSKKKSHGYVSKMFSVHVYLTQWKSLSCCKWAIVQLFKFLSFYIYRSSYTVLNTACLRSCRELDDKIDTGSLGVGVVFTPCFLYKLRHNMLMSEDRCARRQIMLPLDRVKPALC